MLQLTWLKKNGKGESIEEAKSMGTYIPAYGKLSACKHANGKDWWVIVLEYNTNKYHRYLLNKDGIKEIGVQAVGDKDANGVGISVFSPDGTKYARHNNISASLG